MHNKSIQVALTLLCACGSAPGGATGTKPPPAPCSLETDDGTAFKATVDMGRTFVGEVLGGKATFVNRGGSACQVQPIGDDLTPFSTDFVCGATCQPVEVEPGGSLSIAFLFRPTKVGFYDQTVKLATGVEGTTLRIRLRAVAAVWDVVCTPAKPLDLGTVVQGTSDGATITCKNEGNVATTFGFKVVDATGQLSLTLPSMNGTVSLDPAYSVDVPVTFQAAKVGPDIDSVPFAGEIHIDDDQEQKRIAIPVTASVIPYALEIDPPPPYDFGFVRPGWDAYLPLTLRNRSTEPLPVTQLAIDGGSDPEFELYVGAALPFTIPGRDASRPGINEVFFELHFATSAEDLGARTGEVLLGVDDPGGKTLRLLDLSGFAGGPLMSCSWPGAPGVLDFGKTTVGSPSTLPITCSNVSSFDDPTTDADNLLVLSPAMKNDPSSYKASIPGGPLPQGYAVNQGFTIDVQYDPQRASARDDDEVVLRTNDSAHREYHIEVTGSAQ